MAFATRTWVTGELVTASIGNAQWRDNIDLLQRREIFFGIGDVGGDIITTGVKGYREISFNGTITGWTLLGSSSSGSIQLDLWKDTYANFPPTVADTITAGDKPLISGTNKNQDLAPTGWTTSILAGDILAVNVDSITTFKQVSLTLRVLVA